MPLASAGEIFSSGGKRYLPHGGGRGGAAQPPHERPAKLATVSRDLTVCKSVNTWTCPSLYAFISAGESPGLYLVPLASVGEPSTARSKKQPSTKPVLVALMHSLMKSDRI